MFQVSEFTHLAKTLSIINLHKTANIKLLRFPAENIPVPKLMFNYVMLSILVWQIVTSLWAVHLEKYS